MRRKRDHDAQTRRIVLQREFPAVQTCNRRCEAEAETRPGLGRVRAEAHEPFDHACPVRLGDARPTVRHGQDNALTRAARADNDLGRGLFA